MLKLYFLSGLFWVSGLTTLFTYELNERPLIISYLLGTAILFTCMLIFPNLRLKVLKVLKRFTRLFAIIGFLFFIGVFIRAFYVQLERSDFSFSIFIIIIFILYFLYLSFSDKYQKTVIQSMIEFFANTIPYIVGLALLILAIYLAGLIGGTNIFFSIFALFAFFWIGQFFRFLVNACTNIKEPVIFNYRHGDLLGVFYTLISPFILIQITAYILSFWKWFNTEHLIFWNGFKELLWVLCPVANLFYVKEFWIPKLNFIINFCYNHVDYWDWIIPSKHFF